jgi:hypothetical protein
MKLRDGILVQLLLVCYTDLNELRLINVLELLYQHDLRVLFYRLCNYRLLLYALIMFLTGLHNHGLLLITLSAVIDHLDRLIEVNMIPAELHLSLCLCCLLGFCLCLDDLPLLSCILLGLENFFPFLHLCLHLHRLLRLHLLLQLLRCSYLSLLHELAHLGLLVFLPPACSFLLGECIELSIHYGVLI